VKQYHSTAGLSHLVEARIPVSPGRWGVGSSVSLPWVGARGLVVLVSSRARELERGRSAAGVESYCFTEFGVLYA